MATLREMAAEVRAVNVSKGWRGEDGSPTHSFGEAVALLHSEVSEALEAYRRWGLADATKPVCGNEGHTGNPCPTHGMGKPEGVGSELADVLIRLLDVTDAFGLPLFDMDSELGDVAGIEVPAGVNSFGELMAWLHFRISALGCVPHPDPDLSTRVAAPHVLRALVTAARRCGVDLDAEYARKVAFNRTREFRHGGRNL